MTTYILNSLDIAAQLIWHEAGEKLNLDLGADGELHRNIVTDGNEM